MTVRNIPVAEDDAGVRLDRWFRRYFPGLTHARLQKLLRTGQIRVDGSRVRSSVRVQPGQLVRIPPQANDDSGDHMRTIPSITGEDRAWMRSLIIHEDAAIIALNKPPGIPVQGGIRTTRNLDDLLPALVGQGEDKPRLVHRLDRDTSGVLLLARRASMASSLARAFRNRDVFKTYWALVAGVPQPGEGVIEVPLRKRAGHDGYELVVPDPDSGRDAVTEYRVANRLGTRISWLVLNPRTGRTHQLRAHCALMETPIIGDRKYGRGQESGSSPIAEGLHLHARAITFPHPSGGTITVSAPLPVHMAETWQALGLDPEAEP